MSKLDYTKPCPLYKKCGGCQLQNMDYQKQLKWKQIKVERLLKKFCKVDDIKGMYFPYHYRNKVQAAFGMTKNKQIISGVYQSSSHRIVAVNQCMIEDKKSDEIIVYIRELLKSFKLQAYDEYSSQGFLRHVLVKRGFSTNQIMVVLVTAVPIFPAKKNFVGALLKKYPEITTIVMNINPYQTSLVLGERQTILYGKGYIEDVLCGCRFRISPKSFYQINPTQTQILYNKAIEMAGITGNEVVVDTYCGIGTIGLIASKKAKKVIGVEINKDAIKDAIFNAKMNKINNVRFFNVDASDFMVDMASKGENVDVLFMDPPRSGSDEKFLSSTIKLSPKKIVYISCNVETQERDLTYLVNNGYTVKQIQPVDMFPHTNHVESVVLLTRKDK